MWCGRGIEPMTFQGQSEELPSAPRLRFPEGDKCGLSLEHRRTGTSGNDDLCGKGSPPYSEWTVSVRSARAINRHGRESSSRFQGGPFWPSR